MMEEIWDKKRINMLGITKPPLLSTNCGNTATVLSHPVSTQYTQLFIKALPYVGYLLTDNEIELYRLFYLFNRVNGGCVVFAP